MDRLIDEIVKGFLRVSGGVSSSNWTSCEYGWFSPRKRRCFLLVEKLS